MDQLIRKYSFSGDSYSALVSKQQKVICETEREKENIVHGQNYIQARHSKNRPPLRTQFDKNNYTTETNKTMNDLSNKKTQKSRNVMDYYPQRKQTIFTTPNNIPKSYQATNTNIDREDYYSLESIQNEQIQYLKIQNSFQTIDLQRPSTQNNLQDTKARAHSKSSVTGVYKKKQKRNACAQTNENETMLTEKTQSPQTNEINYPLFSQRSYSISARQTDNSFFQKPPSQPKYSQNSIQIQQSQTSKLKLNIKSFVHDIIQTKISSISQIDRIFEQNLNRYIDESSQFIQNHEKHYRLKFMIDLVTSLVVSIQNYVTLQPSNKQVIEEKQKFQIKVEKLKECEDDLKSRILEFEDAFHILTDVISTYDQNKKDFIENYLKKQKLGKISQFKLEHEQMYFEDQRQLLLREKQKTNDRQDFLNRELSKLKESQLKLSQDISDFSSFKVQFDKDKSQKLSLFDSMKLQLEQTFLKLNQDLKLKESNLKKFEQDLRSREKSITNLILNNRDACDENLLQSCEFPSSSGSLTNRHFDFEQFLGKFESHKDELIQREKAISNFLNKNATQRSSMSSLYSVEWLKEASQKDVKRFK